MIENGIHKENRVQNGNSISFNITLIILQIIKPLQHLNNIQPKIIFDFVFCNDIVAFV